MEQIKCPGQDTRHWKFDDIFTLECPKCGAEIEFFKDDTRRRCAWCGHLFYNPKIELGCAEYCQYAEKCVPELVKEKKAMQLFRDRLRDEVLARLGFDPRLKARLEQYLALAPELLKAEGGDPKVVFAALLLLPLPVEEAEEVLRKLDTEPEILAEILEVRRGEGDPDHINRKIVEDVKRLAAEARPDPEGLHTRTARRLAATRGPEA